MKITKTLLNISNKINQANEEIDFLVEDLKIHINNVYYYESQIKMLNINIDFYDEEDFIENVLSINKKQLKESVEYTKKRKRKKVLEDEVDNLLHQIGEKILKGCKRKYVRD